LYKILNIYIKILILIIKNISLQIFYYRYFKIKLEIFYLYIIIIEEKNEQSIYILKIIFNIFN